MAKNLPFYKDHERTYLADTCAPLIRAMKAGQVRQHALVCGHYPGQRLPRGVLPGLKSVGFWDADHPQDWGLDWHRNEGIELTLLENGRLAYSVDEQDLVLKPGDLTIARPWQFHRVGNPHVAAGRLHWVILDVGVRRPHQAWKWPSWLVLSAGDLKELTGILRQNEQPVWRAPDDLRRCFARIAQAVEGNRSDENLSRLTIHLNELFLLVLEMCRRSDVPLDASLSNSLRTVQIFLHDLAGNFAALSQEWTVPRMAEHCSLGATHFIHHCKQITGATPLQFLNQCRLEAARQLLLGEPKRSVTSIALACGFSSAQYFATVFWKHFGVSPRDFRRQRPLS